VSWPGWLTLAQLLTAIATIAALLFTAQSLRATQSQIGLSEQGQLTDRFGKAVEQLGSDKVDIRLGGIYALERLALDSARDHPTVMEVLTAYVRRSAPKSTCSQLASSDLSQLQLDVHDTVQAAISVIRRRNIAFDIRILDLDNTCLRDANFRGADLIGADLSGAVLSGADLIVADLSGADLSGADLSGADLSVADLSGADLSGADLSGADLFAADLFGADLTDARGYPR
jgi:uncharacterized protein YjbI with pentapeptide repeats